MRQVWKYIVPLTDDDVPLLLPRGGKILEVGHGGIAPNGVAFWYEFEKQDEAMSQGNNEERTFRIFGTGHEIPPEYQHVGTVDLHLAIALVWHLYEKIR